MMQRRGIPDVVGLKLPAAVALLDAAGVSYTEEKLEPVGAGRRNSDGAAHRKAEKETGAEKEKISGDGPETAEPAEEEKRPESLRVIRQRLISKDEVCLSVCSVPE